MNKTPQRAAYYVVFWQAVIVLLVAFISLLIANRVAAYSALLGGAASVLPSFLFAQQLFKTTAARNAQRIVVVLFVGELLKLILSGVLLVIMIMWLPVSVLPLVIGFVSAHLGFWIAPLTKKMNI